MLVIVMRLPHDVLRLPGLCRLLVGAYEIHVQTPVLDFNACVWDSLNATPFPLRLLVRQDGDDVWPVLWFSEDTDEG